jgi:hypothetical protein
MSLGPGLEGLPLEPSAPVSQPLTDDALSDRAQDEHGEVDEAADDHDHAEQERDEGRPEELLEHLRRHESAVVWETCERIMVAVTTVPGTDGLLRRAARMAARLKGELDVVHVIALRKASRAAPSKQNTAERRGLVQVSTPEEDGCLPGADPADS